jgi:hypothetical protein
MVRDAGLNLISWHVLNEYVFMRVLCRRSYIIEGDESACKQCPENSEQLTAGKVSCGALRHVMRAQNMVAWQCIVFSVPSIQPLTQQ